MENTTEDFSPPPAPPTPDPALLPPADTPRVTLAFTGTGAEYFRIWAINLTLTICTLGLYSAWAKVRRLRYFYQHTSLDGSAFDYTANPLSLLFGRVMAVGMLVLYYLAFEYSPHTGLAMVLAMTVGLPFLLWQSNRFKARNTRFRGLEFGFEGDLREAYKVYVPVIAIWFGPAVLAAYLLRPDQQIWVLVYSLASLLLFPIFHAMFRRYVQSSLRFGDSHFSFKARIWDFVKIWAKGAGITTLAVVLATVLAIGIVLAIGAVFGKDSVSPTVVGVTVGLIFVWIGYALLGSYFIARFQNLVWNETQIGPLHLHSHVKARKFIGLQCMNTLLVLLTLGLYRPFAAIRVAKFRLECVSATGLHNIDQVAAGARQSQRGAVGESTAEFFDLDVGL